MENIPEQEGRNWIDYLFTQITDLLDHGEYDRALTFADHGLEAWPESTYLLYLKSIILQNLGRPNETLQILETARSINPFENRVIEAIGRNLLYQGYYHTALSTLKHFDMMTGGLAGSIKVIMNFCRACTGDTKPVLEYCDGIIEMNENNPEAAGFVATIQALKIVALIQNHEEADAIALATEINDEYNDQPFVVYAKGIAAWKGENLSTAADLLRQSCEIQPLDMRAKSELADILIHLGNDDEAYEIRRTISGFFGVYDSNQNPSYRAEELIKKGDYEEAEKFLSWAREKYPDQNELVIPLISTLYFTGQYDQAVSLADSVINTQYAWKTIYLKASAHYTTGKNLNAIRCLISAAARDRTFLFLTLFHMRNEGFFKDPKTEIPEAMAFQVLITDGIEPAIPLFEALADTNPGVPEYRVFLSLCYVMANRKVLKNIMWIIPKRESG